MGKWFSWWEGEWKGGRKMAEGRSLVTPLTNCSHTVATLLVPEEPWIPLRKVLAHFWNFACLNVMISSLVLSVNNGRKTTCSQSVNQVDYIVRIADFPADSLYMVTSTFTMMLRRQLNIGKEVFYHWRSGQPWGVCITKKINRSERTFITGNNYCVWRKSACFSEAP